MRLLAVLAERLAVIGGEDNQGAFAQPSQLELRDELADHAVHP